MKEQFTIMLSAAGRRVALLRLLRQSAAEAGFNCRLTSRRMSREESTRFISGM